MAVAVHVAQQTADVGGGEVGLQGPRCIGVAEGHRQVRHIAQHHSLVRHGLSQVAGPSVDAYRHVAQHVQLQTGGHHHDVGGKFIAGGEPQAPLRETFDARGHHRGAALANLAKQIAVRHQAHALVPRLVARREMRVDVELRTHLFARHLDEALFHLLGTAASQLIQEHVEQNILPARERIGRAFGQTATEPLRQPVDRRPGDHVAR